MGKKQGLLTLVLGFIILISFSFVVSAEQGQPKAPIEKYRMFLNDLPKDDIESVHKAVQEFKTLAGTNRSENDAMFLAFRDYYYTIIKISNDKLFKKETKISYFDNGVLWRNGLRILDYEGDPGRCFGQSPSFFCMEFQDYLSGSLNEYNQIQKEELLETGNEEKGMYLIDDLALMIAWDQLSDRIIKWEVYLAKYPQSSLKDDVESSIRLYFNIYTTGGGLENTPAYRLGTLTDTVKVSYERFIEHYPESKFTGLIKDYYAILRLHDFSLSPEIIEFLQQHSIKTRYLETQLKKE